VVDKILALRGGAELVALWAQLSSVIEMIAGVALAGVGAGLSGARRPNRASRAPAALPAAALSSSDSACPSHSHSPPASMGALFATRSGKARPAAHVFALAAIAGCAAMIHGLVNSFWLGQQRRERMLALAALLALLSLSAAALARAVF
jgi:hypothetical protein